MIKWFKRLFCRHNYPVSYPEDRCLNCDKKLYRIAEFDKEIEEMTEDHFKQLEEKLKILRKYLM